MEGRDLGLGSKGEVKESASAWPQHWSHVSLFCSIGVPTCPPDVSNRVSIKADVNSSVSLNDSLVIRHSAKVDVRVVVGTSSHSNNTRPSLMFDCHCELERRACDCTPYDENRLTSQVNITTWLYSDAGFQILNVTLSIQKIRQGTNFWVRYDYKRDGCAVHQSIEFALNITNGGERLWFPAR